MFENRFQHLQASFDTAAGSAQAGFAFVAIPIANPQCLSTPDQAFGTLTWIYQQAFESARDAQLAKQRRESFAASLN